MTDRTEISRRPKTVPAKEAPINDPLWRAFVANPSTKLRQRLFDQHKPDVKQILSHYLPMLPTTVDYDALRQEGYNAAYKAIDTFEPARGLKFATYIQRRIGNALLVAVGIGNAMRAGDGGARDRAEAFAADIREGRA